MRPSGRSDQEVVAGYRDGWTAYLPALTDDEILAA
jgi:hypothetical protein